MRGEATEIFIPDPGEGGAYECTVLECGALQGSRVAVGEILARVRSGRVNLGVQAPLSGTLVSLHASDGATMRVGDLLAEILPSAPDPAPVAPPPAATPPPQDATAPPQDATAPRQRSASSADVLRRAPLGIAATISASAFAWPIAVLLASTLVAAVFAASRDAMVGHTGSGSADIVVLPLRLVRGMARRVKRTLGSLSWIVGAVFRAGLWLGVAVGVPAVLGAVWWLVAEGNDGLLAAIRMAVYGNAVQVFAVIVSFLALRRAMTEGRTPTAIGRALTPLPEPVLTGLALAGLVWIVGCAVFIPTHRWAPASSFRAAVHALPASLRDNVDDLRASIVGGEARKVVACMTTNGRTGWRVPRAFVDDQGALRIGVRPSRLHPPGRRSFAVLALAINNEVSPSGATVAIVPAAGTRPATFTTLATDQPVTDIERVLERIVAPTTAAAKVPRAAEVTSGDISVALRCSAAAL